MNNPLRIAVAGLGTVGVGVVKILESHRDLIQSRCGRSIEIVAVSASNRARDRGVDLSGYQWFDNALDFAGQDNIDVVVELIGGSDGIARELAQKSIASGKSFVTANKALIAHHGATLANAAQEAGVAVRYEAAVAGGIPIIKAIGEGLAANRLNLVYGILNGTCNYILTTMEAKGQGFDEVLVDAQRLGYAEADPTFDVDGIDTAHKLAILSSVAFATETDFDHVYTEGIRRIEAVDIEYAREIGYRIKLLGISRLTEKGLEQRVHPAMVKVEEPIAQVEEAFNAVVAEGDFIDRTFYQGRGAGQGPTASAVVADIIDIARGHSGPAFFVPADQLARAEPVPISEHEGSYYIRLHVQEKSGVIADITSILKEYDVSLDVMLQKGHEQDGSVYVVLVTHKIQEKILTQALARIGSLSSVQEEPLAIRIENL